MTFDDDMIHLEFPGGLRRVSCKSIGIDWPPPSTLNVSGFEMKRESFSRLTDEQRQGMTHVIRGAVYVPITSCKDT